MIFNSTINKKIIFSIHKYDLIIILFIFTVSIFTLYNLVNSDLNSAFGSTEKESPIVYDQTLLITQLTDELQFPTGIDFLGESDILVIEKNTGQVKRILDGKILNEPVLDVNVASESERGLLGLAILNTKGLNLNITTTTTNEKAKENNSTNEIKVFLFYTETKDIDNGDILGNRLYKYDFVEGKLINPKLLLDLPFLPGPSHNGGVLDIGQDNNLYLVVGDINREGDQEYMTLAQNIKDSKLPDGRGGVLRLTVDGEPVLEDDNFSSLGNSSLLNFYYGYGIRNSFGIGFDPVTGILWETENGSNYGDEINVILPGFNGGWRQVLGLSTEYENFKNKEFDRSKLILFGGKGKYYDPVFTWVDTVAPTAITFINSKIFGEEYENDLLVGSVKQGRIFHFDLNETRTGLDLHSTEQLVDKMANVDEELEPVILGKNFGIITDIEINPYDGKIYVVDGQPKNGKIYQIYPKELN